MGTDRRLLGIALLAAIIGVGSVAHTFAGWQIPGKPVAMALPRGPMAGSCLGPMVSDAQLVDPVDEVRAVPCSEPHSAEIFFVGALTGSEYPFHADRMLIGTAEMQRAQRVCHDKARRYVGEFDASARWRVQPKVYTKVSVPNRAAWNIGQRWFSCQVVPLVHDFPIAFSGTAAGAQSAFRPPSILGACADSANSVSIACPLPHRVEQLSEDHASRSFEAERSVDLTGRPSCTDLASKIIGTADPTFGGRLVITDHRQPLVQGCWAESANGTRLTGSLIGHGAGPLPHG